MKTEWDYTELADAYLKRPDYAEEAVDRMMDIAGVLSGGGQMTLSATSGRVRRI